MLHVEHLEQFLTQKEFNEFQTLFLFSVLLLLLLSPTPFQRELTFNKEAEFLYMLSSFSSKLNLYLQLFKCYLRVIIYIMEKRIKVMSNCFLFHLYNFLFMVITNKNIQALKWICSYSVMEYGSAFKLNSETKSGTNQCCEC